MSRFPLILWASTSKQSDKALALPWQTLGLVGCTHTHYPDAHRTVSITASGRRSQAVICVNPVYKSILLSHLSLIPGSSLSGYTCIATTLQDELHALLLSLEGVEKARYPELAAFTVYVYDYCLTFNQEVSNALGSGWRVSYIMPRSNTSGLVLG